MEALRLVCPGCKRVLRKGKKLSCTGCGKSYRIHKGIPVFLQGLKGIKAAEQETYDASAARLRGEVGVSKRMRTKVREMAEAAEKELGFRDKELVLDVGCGVAVLPTFFRKNIRYVGVDLSLEELLVAEKKGFYVNADAENLPFEDSVFDKVVSFNLLEHVTRPGKVLDNLIRVCKNRGKVGIVVPNARANIVRGFFWRLGRFFRKPGKPSAPSGERFHREFCEEEVLELLKRKGLSPLSVRYLSFFPSEALLPILTRNRTLDSLLSSAPVRAAEKVFETCPLTKRYGGSFLMSFEVVK